MTNKKIICLVILIFMVGFGLGISHFTNAANTTYTPMEKIPGTSSVSDFPSYVKAIYKFGIWTIGIAALLMIMIGGFMYMTSAGNNATMGKAKGYITDALIGLVMAMTAYLLLYTINPSLVNISIKFPSSSSSGTSSSSAAKTSSQIAENLAECKKECSSKTGDELTKCNTACNEAANKAATENTGGRTSTKATCSNLNSSLNSELSTASANSGVPTSVLASFMQRECPQAMSNASACATNNSYGAGGAMQFTDGTWNDKRYGCTGSKFNRQDALNCAANKIKVDSGGDYSETGLRKAAKKYCGSCTDVNACGGDYCDGIMSNYDVYKECTT